MFTKSDVEQLEAGFKEAKIACKDIESFSVDHFYPEVIIEFMESLCNPPWVNFGYDPSEAQTIVCGIATASYDELRTVLTYACRRERFCSGSWIRTLNGEFFPSVILRLNELLKES